MHLRGIAGMIRVVVIVNMLLSCGNCKDFMSGDALATNYPNHNWLVYATEGISPLQCRNECQKWQSHEVGKLFCEAAKYYKKNDTCVIRFDSKDRCIHDNYGCSELCHRTQEGYSCSCESPGLILDSDGKTCVSRCEVDNWGCEDNCHLNTNTGEYSCSCNGGGSLGSDGKSCIQAHAQCSSYTQLTDAIRKVGYCTGSSCSVTCDSSMGNNWYRFTGSAGTQMATSCPATWSCGTHAPMWAESHPTQFNVETTVKVCAHWSGNCCNWNTNIKIIRCPDFYIYQLPNAPACSLRYCGI